MKKVVVNLEDSLAVSEKVKNKWTAQLSNYTPGYIPREMKTRSYKDFYENIHSKII